ncbi:hypothetical protein ZWY2020_018036 [Hordeum vulgare]|nr:hypothetical protein ZWY2020_018036 [Hordeum vulgare]
MRHHRKSFLIEGSGLPYGTVHFACKSRVCFSNKSMAELRAIGGLDGTAHCMDDLMKVTERGYIRSLASSSGIFARRDVRITWDQKMDDPEGSILFLVGISRMHRLP